MDDLGFSSVWSDSPPKPKAIPLPLSPPAFHSIQNGAVHDFNDYDDDPFSTSSFDNQPIQGDAFPAGEDDEFGDFGDFGDTQVTNGFDDDMGGFEEGNADAPPLSSFDGGFEHELPPDPGPSTWEPLRLRPSLPTPANLSRHIEALLASTYGRVDPETVMSDDPIRQVEGIGQILFTTQRYALSFYQNLHLAH